MRSVADIISLWPSAEHFAADIGLKYASYARVMKMRGRIADRYWDKVAAAAQERGLDVTRADLEAAHEPSAPTTQPDAEDLAPPKAEPCE